MKDLIADPLRVNDKSALSKRPKMIIFFTIEVLISHLPHLLLYFVIILSEHLERL